MHVAVFASTAEVRLRILCTQENMLGCRRVATVEVAIFVCSTARVRRHRSGGQTDPRQRPQRSAAQLPRPRPETPDRFRNCSAFRFPIRNFRRGAGGAGGGGLQIATSSTPRVRSPWGPAPFILLTLGVEALGPLIHLFVCLCVCLSDRVAFVVSRYIDAVTVLAAAVRLRAAPRLGPPAATLQSAPTIRGEGGLTLP